VARQADPDDRRIKRVAATEAGRAASAELRESLNFARAPLAALAPAEREQLRDLLQRIVEGAQQQR
jgi:DNA-binding MarR family transcriptional regulator